MPRASWTNTSDRERKRSSTACLTKRKRTTRSNEFHRIHCARRVWRTASALVTSGHRLVRRAGLQQRAHARTTAACKTEFGAGAEGGLASARHSSLPSTSSPAAVAPRCATHSATTREAHTLERDPLGEHARRSTLESLPSRTPDEDLEPSPAGRPCHKSAASFASLSARGYVFSLCCLLAVRRTSAGRSTSSARDTGSAPSSNLTSNRCTGCLAKARSTATLDRSSTKATTPQALEAERTRPRERPRVAAAGHPLRERMCFAENWMRWPHCVVIRPAQPHAAHDFATQVRLLCATSRSNHLVGAMCAAPCVGAERSLRVFTAIGPRHVGIIYRSFAEGQR